MSVFGCTEECIYTFVQRANTRIRQTSVTKVNRSQNKYVETDLTATASQDTELPPHDRFIFFIINIANEIFFSHVLILYSMLFTFNFISYLDRQTSKQAVYIFFKILLQIFKALKIDCGFCAFSYFD